MASNLTAPVDIGGGTAGAGSTLAFTTTADVLPGQTILVFVAFADTTRTVSSITDSSGNTYALSGPVDGGSFRFYIGLATPIGTPLGGMGLKSGDTITINKTSATYAAAAQAVKVAAGFKLSSPLDVAGTVATGTNTAPTSNASGVLAQADEIIFGAQASASTSSGQTSTVSSPFTAVGNRQFVSGIDLRIGYQIVTATTSQTMVGTLSTSRAWGSWLRSYRAGPVPDTLRFSSSTLSVDITGPTRTLTSMRLEVDMLETAVRNSFLSLEADTKGGPTLLGQFLVEVDIQPSLATRVPPRIIS